MFFAACQHIKKHGSLSSVYLTICLQIYTKCVCVYMCVCSALALNTLGIPMTCSYLLLNVFYHIVMLHFCQTITKTKPKMCLKIDGGKGGESKLNGISYAYSITYVLNINRFEMRNEMLRIEQTQQ